MWNLTNSNNDVGRVVVLNIVVSTFNFELDAFKNVCVINSDVLLFVGE